MSYQRMLVALAVCGLVAGGVALASIPDAGGVIHGCYARSGGSIRVIDDGVTGCKQGETAISWNQTGPAGPVGAQGPAGPIGLTGPAGPGVDWTKVYKVDSANVTVTPNQFGQAIAECHPGDVAVGGNNGVNGVNFLVYFDGTHILPDKIGSPTDVAGYYLFYVHNNNPVGGSNILIFSTVYCLPPA